MQSKTFIYEGNTFEPIGNLRGGFYEKTNNIDYTAGALLKNVVYKDFYKVAKKNHASCDLYKINNSDKMYILSGSINDNGNFYEVKSSAIIKKCEEYKRWYR